MQVSGKVIESVQEGDDIYMVFVVDDANGIGVPKDERNSDCQAVQAWIEKGGVTTPIPPLPE